MSYTKTLSRRQQLADRLMQVDRESILSQVDELLTRAEMQARHEESMEAIRNGDVMTAKEFRQSNSEWLRKKGIG